MATAQWIRDFARDLAEPHDGCAEIDGVESWVGDHLVMFRGTYVESGKPFAYGIPIATPPSPSMCTALARHAASTVRG